MDRNRWWFAGLFLAVILAGAYLGRSGPSAPSEDDSRASQARSDSEKRPGLSQPAPPPAIAAGIEAILANRMAEALRDFQQVPPQHPFYPFALHNVAVLKEKLGDLAGSREAFEALLARHPDDPEALIGLGWTLFRLGEYEEADRATRRALKRSPSNALALYNLGLCAVARGQTASAYEAYKRAMHQDQGRVHFFSSFNDLDEFRSQHPDNAAASLVLALFARALGWHDMEGQDLERFLRSEPPPALAGSARRLLSEARAAEKRAKPMRTED